ncbi:pisatin demethylase [Xylaria bambusicola]|uniref:pisatin demethylase n=1 Tax=Xylaria bambusicola TaxID=326684 RepID=UPI002008862E|nr:pisatin demethylase [Xylaria bambusicola]KAI0509404.1 pisatin demethylase [Xylaria bambusicola]
MGIGFIHLAWGSFLLWYLISSIITWYRLRHVPGPFLAKFSYLWLARTAGDYVYRDLCKMYGPLVRIGPNELTTDDPEFLKRAAAVRGVYGKGRWYVGTRFNPYRDVMFTTLDIPAHDKLKSQIGASFKGREIPLLEPGMDEQVKALIANIRQNMSSNPSSVIDLAPLMSYFTMDVITKVAFGQEYGYLKANEDLYSFLKEVRDNWPKFALMVDIPLVRDILLNPVSLKLFGPSVTDSQGMGKLMGIAREYVSKRYDPGAMVQRDLLGSWIRNGLTKDQAEAEGLFLIIAGSETTASALRITMLHIITCPRVYIQLKQEIRDAVIDRKVDSPIKFEEAKRLPYLEAVVYEGLRMRPPVPGLFPKSVPPEGDVVNGSFIPGGTVIGMNTSSIFSSTAHFGEDAAIFRPERFYEADDQKRTELEKMVELGFGYGRFQCSGKSVAFMELHKVLFELLRTFDFQVARPTSPWKSRSYSVFIEKDMWVKVSEAEKIN